MMVNVVSGSTKDAIAEKHAKKVVITPHLAAVLREKANHMKAKKLLFAGDQQGSPGLKPGRTKAGHRRSPRNRRVMIFRYVQARKLMTRKARNAC
jgi:hypothetical protein